MNDEIKFPYLIYRLSDNAAPLRLKRGVSFYKYDDISPQKLSHTTSFWQNFDSNSDLPGSRFVSYIFVKYYSIVIFLRGMPIRATNTNTTRVPLSI